MPSNKKICNFNGCYYFLWCICVSRTFSWFIGEWLLWSVFRGLAQLRYWVYARPHTFWLIPRFGEAKASKRWQIVRHFEIEFGMGIDWFSSVLCLLLNTNINIIALRSQICLYIIYVHRFKPGAAPKQYPNSTNFTYQKEILKERHTNLPRM